jgi:hypothetical protein
LGRKKNRFRFWARFEGMAFIEDCIERSVALAATCGWLAFGGGAEAIAGVAIGGAGLAALVSNSVRRHGPESEAALKSIRKRILKDLHAHATAERWDNRADLEAADAAMERALTGCFLDRQALAASARHKEGFPMEATRLILKILAEREPGTFGPSGSQAARDYAGLVIRTALDAAIENEQYFKNLQPHLLMETLRGIGSVEEKVDAVHADVTKILEILSRTPPSARIVTEFEKSEVELVVNDRGECILFHNQRFPYELEKLEYNPETGCIEFVVRGGFKKDFGIPVLPALRGHLEKNDGRILIVLMDDDTGEPIEGDYYPLKRLAPK